MNFIPFYGGLIFGRKNVNKEQKKQSIVDNADLLAVSVGIPEENKWKKANILSGKEKLLRGIANQSYIYKRNEYKQPILPFLEILNKPLFSCYIS